MTAPIPIPTAAGTNFSWTKALGLEVTAISGSTSITDRRIKLASAPATGLKVWRRQVNNVAASYLAPALGAADNATTNDAAPGSDTEITTTASSWDAADETTAVSTSIPNGDWVYLTLGVSFLYTGGASQSAAVPSIDLIFDEA